jgi:hypothetical protein
MLNGASSQNLCSALLEAEIYSGATSPCHTRYYELCPTNLPRPNSVTDLILMFSVAMSVPIADLFKKSAVPILYLQPRRVG